MRSVRGHSRVKESDLRQKFNIQLTGVAQFPGLTNVLPRLPKTRTNIAK